MELYDYEADLMSGFRRFTFHGSWGDARTTLEDFFSILLAGASVKRQHRAGHLV